MFVSFLLKIIGIVLYLAIASKRKTIASASLNLEISEQATAAIYCSTIERDEVQKEQEI